MKKVGLKIFSVAAILLIIAFSPFFNQSARAQTEEKLDIYTDGYSILGPSTFILLGGYYDNRGDKNFTTYFEFRKDNSGLKYDSDDLLNQWNLNKDVQETVKLDHSKSSRLLGIVSLDGITRETGNYDISAELNLFSTYYFRAVGYFNDKPNNKFYGSTFNIRTGYIPKGWSFPFTVRIDDTVLPFDTDSVLPGVFASNVTATTAEIKGILYNENPQDLRIKVAYGEEEYDFDSDFLLIGKDGKFSITLKDLKPNTEYHFALWDTEGVLDPSPDQFFRTTSNQLPGVFASEVSDTTATIKAIFDRKQVLDARTGKSPKLKVEYGKNNFDLTSELMEVKSRGVNQVEVSVVLKNLTPSTPYFFRLIDTEKNYDPSPEGRFTTVAKGVKPKTEIQITSLVYNISPQSVLVKANVYNADPETLKLRVIYGDGKTVQQYDREKDAYYYDDIFKQKSDIMKFDKSGDLGSASVTLENLKPETLYRYVIVDDNDPTVGMDEITFPEKSRSFTTMNERSDISPVGGGVGDTEESAEPEGWVKCFSGSRDAEDACDFNAFIDLINRMFRIILFDLSVPFAAIMFMYAGFEILTAGANDEKRKQAITTFTNVGIGLAIVATAFIIVQTVLFILLDPGYGFIDFLAK